MTQFNVDLLRRYIAPAIDEKPEPDFPDLTAEYGQAPHWSGNYFLNSVFNGNFAEEIEPYATSVVARIQIVFGGYERARLDTSEFVERWQLGAPGIGRYIAAVGSWETVFFNMQVVYDLLAKWLGGTISGPEDRTRLVANRIKHCSEDIRDGRLVGPGVPMWLARDRFATIRTFVTYDEIVEQVRNLAALADCLSRPAEASTKLNELALFRAEHFQ